MEEIEIRPFNRITDEAFLFDSWLRSFYNNSPFTKFVSWGEYSSRHYELIKQLVAKSTISMAAMANEPDVIIGYLVYEPRVLHYAYTKEGFRSFGICNKLIKHANLPKRARVTHITDYGKNVIRSWGFIYSPYFE